LFYLSGLPPHPTNKVLMKTVLIVEDDLINARVFSKILTKRGGLDVKHTENVEEVMRIAASGEADIILMDVSLSRSVYQGKSVDGIKITQMLKSDPQTASLPIILVTAHAMEGDRENFLKQSGADDYISKPVVDHQKFVDQIVALLADKDN
jgi:two-component system, cell cycle response regulator DivK